MWLRRRSDGNGRCPRDLSVHRPLARRCDSERAFVGRWLRANVFRLNLRSTRGPVQPISLPVQRDKATREGGILSIVDKVIAAVTPPESEEARMKAREKARAAAGPGDWLAMVL